MWKMENDEQVKKYLGKPSGRLLEEYKKCIREKYYDNHDIYAIIEKNSLEFIGYCSLRKKLIREIDCTEEFCEFWCILAGDKQGIGYGSEVIQKLISIGFNDLNLDKLYAVTKNPWAVKINNALGMEKIGRSDDQDIYVLTREQYINYRD